MQPVWDPDAEKLHGISLEQLHAQGRPPFEVALRMNEVLASRELFSDGPADDERWLRIVFGEAGLHPTFTIRRTHADVLTSQLAAKLGWDSASYGAAKAEADRISPRTHRAEADARHWAGSGVWFQREPQHGREPIEDLIRIRSGAPGNGPGRPFWDGPVGGSSPDRFRAAGSATISGCGTSKDLMRPRDSGMILAHIGKWWFPFRRLVFRRWLFEIVNLFKFLPCRARKKLEVHSPRNKRGVRSIDSQMIQAPRWNVVPAAGMWAVWSGPFDASHSVEQLWDWTCSFPASSLHERAYKGRVEGFHIEATEVMESDHKISLIEAMLFSAEHTHPVKEIDNGQALIGHQFGLLKSTPILRHLSLRIQHPIDKDEIMRDLIEQAYKHLRILLREVRLRK
jgi:hypothetical protein